MAISSCPIQSRSGQDDLQQFRVLSRIVDASPSRLVTDFVPPDAAPRPAPAAAGVRREVGEANSTRISPTAIRLSLGAPNIGQASAQSALFRLLEPSAATGAIESLRQIPDFHRDGVNDRFWSTGVSWHSYLSGERTFFRWLIWPLENKNGDV